jgi:hypothetical protein
MVTKLELDATKHASWSPLYRRRYLRLQTQLIWKRQYQNAHRRAAARPTVPLREVLYLEIPSAMGRESWNGQLCSPIVGVLNTCRSTRFGNCTADENSMNRPRMSVILNFHVYLFVVAASYSHHSWTYLARYWPS